MKYIDIIKKKTSDFINSREVNKKQEDIHKTKQDLSKLINFKIFISYLKLEELKQDLEKLNIDKKTIELIRSKILNKKMETFNKKEMLNYKLGSTFKKSNSMESFGDLELALATVYILETEEQLNIERFLSFSEITLNKAFEIIPILLKNYDADYLLNKEEMNDTREGGSTRRKGEFKPVYEKDARGRHTYFAGRRPSTPTPFTMSPTAQQQPVESVKEDKKIVIEVETITINNDHSEEDLNQQENAYEGDETGFEDRYTLVATEEEEGLLDDYIDDDFSDIAFKKNKLKP